jgi:hypothetical protein
MSDTPATAEPEARPPAEPMARAVSYATFVTRDRRIIELAETDAGGMVLTIEGRGNPLEIDQFQAGALKAAIMSLGVAA